MQITSLYGGPLEFLFVVESTEDPAYFAVSRLISEFKVNSKFHYIVDDSWAEIKFQIAAIKRQCFYK